MSSRAIFLIINLFLVFLSHSFSQIGNGDFELWEDSLEISQSETSIIDSAAQGVPLEWYNINAHQNPTSIGFYRTTDAANGQYAAVINTWYVYVKSFLAKSDSIDIRPDFIAGYYKYLPGLILPGDIDSAIVSIVVYDAFGDTIGTSLNYLDTISTYTSFKFPIEYINNHEGAYYDLLFTSTTTNCPGFNGQCGYLFLDGITFDYFTNSEEIKKSEIQIFPNPFDENINFSETVRSCEVYNLQGLLIKSAKNVGSLFIEGPPGMYIIRVEDEAGLKSTHKLIKSE